MRPTVTTRRAALAGLLAAGAAVIGEHTLAQPPLITPVGRRLAPLWTAWKAAHLAPSGRVVDGLQGGASHSEGQGYGMVLADAMGDAASFAAMWRWTRTHLAIRQEDPLLAWRWRPEADVPVADLNNASDGDLFCAWALLRAAVRFNEPRYAKASRSMAEALAKVCLRVASIDGRMRALLLPGAAGFEHDDHVVYNPSYAMPRALADLGAAHGIDALANAAATAQVLNDQLSVGLLPPDWCAVYAAGVESAPEFRNAFGYEALRIPLFEIWSGRLKAPAVLQAQSLYAETMATSEEVPTRANRDRSAVLERSPDAGYGAIAALVSCASGGLPRRAFPGFTANQPYYPSTLHLLSLVALSEASLECSL